MANARVDGGARGSASSTMGESVQGTSKRAQRRRMEGKDARCELPHPDLELLKQAGPVVSPFELSRWPPTTIEEFNAYAMRPGSITAMGEANLSIYKTWLQCKRNSAKNEPLRKSDIYGSWLPDAMDSATASSHNTAPAPKASSAEQVLRDVSHAQTAQELHEV